ncbi:MAG TPA: MTH938/NDUFAF3 family protein [Acidiferrobacter sp.]|nr:MTH938/NDUFAF3 family protein [Acidiferrobacter sp.]
MKIHLDTSDGRHVIRTYEPGRILIGTASYERSLILTPDRIIDDWRPQHFGELDAQALEELLGLQAEVVLLGTGSKLRFLGSAQPASPTHLPVAIECMDTGAACRTYNLLLSEGRPVAVGLLIADPPPASTG